MSLKLITAPTVEPVTETEAWDHLRVNLDDIEPVDATLIANLIKAATASIDGRDGWLGRTIITQTWEMAMDDFPAWDNPINLRLPPIQSITSIKYIDTNGVEQTISSGDTDYGWQLSEDTHWQPRIRLKYNTSWPSVRDDEPDAVKVRFVCGYSGDGASPEDLRANVPMAIKQAILLLVGHYYENREPVIIGQTVSSLPFAIEALLSPYRVTWL